MLGLDEAGQLLELCQQQIDTYADPEAPVSNDDSSLLDSLSASASTSRRSSSSGRTAIA